MIVKNIIIIIVLSSITSCNYKLFVKRNYVIEDSKGYLVFTQNEVIFYPLQDTIDAKFLGAKSKKDGYRIEFNTDWLDSLSTDYSSLTEIEPKKFSIIPVILRYYLGSVWQRESEKNTFTYWWDEKLQTLRYKVYDFRSIVDISLVRESDIRRLKLLPSKDFDLH